MVAAVAAATARSPSPNRDHASSRRPPLLPSASENATSSRRNRSKEIASRYLPSPSSATSTSTSTATTSTSYSSTSSSASSSSRRFPSPLITHRPSSTTPSRRSISVERSRIRSDPDPPPHSSPAPAPTPPSSAAAAYVLPSTTRRLSVSFQGDSFFYQTTRKPTPSSPSPQRRRPVPTAENSRPAPPSDHRWPAVAKRSANPLARSLDCSLTIKDSILSAVHLQSALGEDSPRRVSFEAGELSLSSDTESVSSGSNSGAMELGNWFPPMAKLNARGVSVPARFWQETNHRMRRMPEPGTPLKTPSPMRRPASPSRAAMTSQGRGFVSPSRGRTASDGTGMETGNGVEAKLANAPSIISFAAEVRRAKKGENRIEEAHLLRLLDNRHLQWRWLNAQAAAMLSVHKVAAEKNLYDAWKKIGELRDSVTLKRIKLRYGAQNIKLTSILRAQVLYLEEWSLLEKRHSDSLQGSIEALKASTLRLPVVGGAKADIHSVKDAVSSAVDVMQAMASSICSLLAKVQGTSTVVAELAKVAEQERRLLEQSRDLLSTVTALHVKQCSLQGHALQQKCKPIQTDPQGPSLI